MTRENPIRRRRVTCGSRYSVISSPSDHAHNALEDQLREQHGRVAYSHKAHEKTADILAHAQRVATATEIVLSALTTTSLLLVVFADSRAGAVISAVLSLLLFGLTLWLRQANLGQRIQQHADTASKLWRVRESYLTLITDLNSPAPEIARIKEDRQELQDILGRIYATAPREAPRAYKQAQDALKNNEELFFSERELDLMLPEGLRRSVRRRRGQNDGGDSHAA